MYCTACGAPRGENARFCPNCGAPFAADPPKPKSRLGWLPYVLLAVMSLIGGLLFFLFPIDTAPTEPESGGSLSIFTEDCFILENGVLYFDESNYDGFAVLSVPSAINGQSVTAIGDSCFEGVSGVTTIILPSSVTSIGYRAFADCPELRGIFVPEAVTAIGAEAFRGCEKLESVYLSTAVTTIGEDAFEDCPYLSWIFYSGFYEEWEALYPQPITPFTWVSCWDGEYLHAGQSQ